MMLAAPGLGLKNHPHFRKVEHLSGTKNEIIALNNNE